ncbi:MAG: type II secretion system protein N [Gammaproteobacteria bacterium]
MTRVWRLVALGVGAYLLVLVTTFPAERVSTMLQDQVADLSLHGVSGSAFSGQAAQVVYQGLDLGPVQWRFRPLALLLGRLEYRLELTHPDNHGQLHAGKTLSGRTTIHDMDIQLLPDRLINHYSPVTIDSSGTLHLVFEAFSPGADFSGEVDGRLEWQDAVILDPISLVLGQLQLDVMTDNGELVGHVVNGGDLGASGELVLSPTYAYRVDLLLRPGNTTSADTRAMLEQSAQRLPNGDYRIDLSGQF